MRVWGTIAAGIWALVSTSALAQGCAPDRVMVSGAWGRAVFSVTVVDTAETRAQGLMHVEEMPTMAGMLFVYDAPHRAGFWMRNTLIALDMMFAGPDGTIQRVHENARPLDETVIDGGDGVQYVLEINGGLARRFGIGAGDRLHHPQIANSCAE